MPATVVHCIDGDAELPLLEISDYDAEDDDGNEFVEFYLEKCTRDVPLVEIPKTVTRIESGAFDDCLSLAEICYGGTVAQWHALEKVSDGVPAAVVHCTDGDLELPMFSIDHGVLTGCARDLPSVEIPLDIIKIGDRAFYTITGKQQQKLIKDARQSLREQVERGYYTEVEAEYLLYRNWIMHTGGYRQLSSAIIHGTITFITDRTSGHRQLSSVIIHATVKEIGISAFEGCTALTDIRYIGTMAQWRARKKGRNWHKDVPATVVHCIDGDAAL